MGSTPGLERSLGGQHGNLLQYSCLENPHGQRSLAGYHGVAKSNMTEQLSTHYNMQSTKDLIFQFNAFALLHLVRQHNFKVYYMFIYLCIWTYLKFYLILVYLILVNLVFYSCITSKRDI